MAAGQESGRGKLVHALPELDRLRADAEQAHAQYPQYLHHWDGWRVAIITRRVRTKMGVAFEAGDRVLVSPDTREERVTPRGRNAGLPYEQWPLVLFATAYSWRNQIDTGVQARLVTEI